MSYLSAFLMGVIVGLILNLLSREDFSFRHASDKKMEENILATKEDIAKVSKDVAEIKEMYKENHNLAQAEEDFYDENGIE